MQINMYEYSFTYISMYIVSILLYKYLVYWLEYTRHFNTLNNLALSFLLFVGNYMKLKEP